jgi:hypothetical protein
MADPSAFIAYPSAPATIGDTIEKAVHDIERLEGRGRFLTWRASDIAGRFIGEKILDDIQARAALVADMSLFNFNVTYEIGFAIGHHMRLRRPPKQSAAHVVERAVSLQFKTRSFCFRARGDTIEPALGPGCS